MVKTIEYLNLSALAYADLKKSDTGLTLDEIIRDEQKNKSRKNFNLSDPQLFALQDSSNPLRSFVLLSQSPLTYTRTVKDRNGIRTITVENEFSCIALQNPETKEIIFAFRGTNNFGDWDTDGLIGSRVFPADWMGQFAAARKFVFQTLNQYGPICYNDQKAMFKAIGQGSNVSFTGHSLGGALAQYMTYKTAKLDKGDAGIKSVTFDAVGIGDNVGVSSIDADKYNSTDHVNSLDWVGTYGLQLGKTVTHIDNSEVDYLSDASGLADEVHLGYDSLDIIFERTGSNFRLRMPGSLDAITVSSWYSSDNYKIETFKSANGSVITHTQVDSLIQAMSSFQKDTGMTWEQAVINQPTQVQSIIQQYWTAPTT